MRKFAVLLVCGVWALCAGCQNVGYDLDDFAQDNITQIHTDLKYFKDAQGRYLHVHGINVSGSTKLPASVDPVSYTGKPFPLEDADWNFKTLRDMGFNTLRLLTIWEAVEPDASGVYDEEYLDYLEQIVQKANEWGIYVFIDMHQDGFSRWLRKFFDDGKDVNALTTLDGLEDWPSPPFNNVIQGDGAPRWAVQLTLPEKNVGGPQWGLPMSLGVPYNETTDVLPLHWGWNLFASLDVVRSFATFFAGRDLYPNYRINGQAVSDYLQESYANAWRQIALRVKDYPNVLGYDPMNEPIGIYALMFLAALLYQEAEATPSGELSDEQVATQVAVLLDEFSRIGMPPDQVEFFRGLYLDYAVLPRTAEQFAAAGFPLHPEADDPYRPNLDAILTLNASFTRTYLQPFLGRVGRAIQDVDPDAIIVIEPAVGFDDTDGLFGFYATPMLKPEGLDQIAYAPHFYADIYPFILEYNPDPRNFTIDEVRFRDYTAGILEATDNAALSLGNPPVILGEFGTYFNFNGIEQSAAEDYIVSAHILDNYYEAMEANLVNRTVWCYSPENTMAWGEGWNLEDFSVLGPDRRPRADDAYSRVTPRFTSGRLLSYKYNSPLSYQEPRPDYPTPYREFTMEMDGLETSAPTEIFVPASKFSDGFYVYLSDGRCHYDEERQILYWYPYDDDPAVQHSLRIRPPYPDYGDQSWDYYFNGSTVVEGR